ncbi:RraA family protein [Cerasicoccus arenae]|uniref:Putative 4-hydroxy-4-methyl-2-oxoglutarate aldolase n=1 Tax=Cerasicoccus arenae TaxID=424488 RepID=A0A8J3GCW3_9BACT|nr:RraA family protein [Cerasicoccus arenae]MBK1857116.1 RraA family protein [Cerasicoccus arenae]GHB92458.1 demethylmenaquinone methyltransferase [Cerasicoccus arenae]
MSEQPKKVGMNLDAFKASRSEDRKLCEFPIPVQELCERYEALFTAAVNDVLREMQLTHQTLPNNILPLKDEMKVAGPIFTIKGAKSLLVKDEMKERAKMLESIPRNHVVVWDTSGDDESAQWGEVMTMASKRRGCRGAIVDGGVRDTDRVLPQEFPVFVKYRSSNGMLGRFRISGWQVPVRIGEVDVFPGDVVFGDIDGAIIIPRAIAYDVLIRAEEIVASENELIEWVKSGMSTEDIVAKGGYF